MAHSALRRIVDWVAAALLLAVPLAVLGSSLKDPGRLNAVDRLVLRVASPAQRGACWVVDGLGSVWSRYIWLIDVQAENGELRRENERLRREVAEASHATADASRLEELVALKARVPAETIGARVVAMGMSPLFRVTRITLDRGEGRVKPGMPVLAPEGAVGRIFRVYGGYADVVLTVDADSAIDVIVSRTGSRGVLKGLGHDNAYSCQIEYLDRSEQVKEGDLVVTSGLGGVFPPDVPVGRIQQIDKTEPGLYQKVIVEPAVDFSGLSAVLVVLAPPPPPDPTAKVKKVAEPAFGTQPHR